MSKHINEGVSHTCSKDPSQTRGCHCAAPSYCVEVADKLYDLLESFEIHDNDKSDIAAIVGGIETPGSKMAERRWLDFADALFVMLGSHFDCQNIIRQIGLDLGERVEFEKMPTRVVAQRLRRLRGDNARD